jgi:hypothetical protein
MTRPISLKGFRIKAGKVERDIKRLPINLQLKQKGSKRIRPARRGTIAR